MTILMAIGTSMTPIFISYSPRDSEHARRLCVYLAPLVNQGVISLSDRNDIQPGDDISAAMKLLNDAGMILILVSPYYLADPVCMAEAEQALAHRQDNGVRVIPVLLRACLWESAPWAHLTHLPSDKKPLVDCRSPGEAFAKIASTVRGMLDRNDPTKPDASTLPTLRGDTYFLNHTAFLRPGKQEEFQRRTGVPLPHYDIRVIVDSYDEENLDQIERVEYVLDSTYPQPVQVRTAQHRREKFLLKELAHGEYVLRARVSTRSGTSIDLYRYISLWPMGLELP